MPLGWQRFLGHLPGDAVLVQLEKDDRVAAYEASGRSVFFSFLDASLDYGSLWNQLDFQRRLENSFGWLLDNKEKSSTYNVPAVARNIPYMYEECANIVGSARAPRKDAGMRRLGSDLAVTALSAGGVLGRLQAVGNGK